jgi:hypothetical protein
MREKTNFIEISKTIHKKREKLIFFVYNLGQEK